MERDLRISPSNTFDSSDLSQDPWDGHVRTPDSKDPKRPLFPNGIHPETPPRARERLSSDEGPRTLTGPYSSGRLPSSGITITELEKLATNQHENGAVQLRALMRLNLDELDEASLGIIATHLQFIVSQQRKEFYARITSLQNSGQVQEVDAETFAWVMDSLFGLPFPERIHQLVFDTLDTAREGTISWPSIWRFLSPTSSFDKIMKQTDSPVTSVCLSADCSRLGFGSPVGAIVIGTDQDEILLSRLYRQGVSCVALSSDGSTFFVGTYRDEGCSDAHVERFGNYGGFDAAEPEQRYCYESDILCMALSHDNQVLAIGGNAKSVMLFGVNQAIPFLQIPYPSAVSCVSIARPSDTVVSLATGIAIVQGNEQRQIDEVTVPHGQLHEIQLWNEEAGAVAIFAQLNPSDTNVLPFNRIGRVLSGSSRNQSNGISSACRVVFVACVIKPFSTSSGTIQVIDRENRKYELDPKRQPVIDFLSWPASAGCSPREMSVGTQVIVGLPGRVVRRDITNVVTVGGKFGSVLCCKFNDHGTGVALNDSLSASRTLRSSPSMTDIDTQLELAGMVSLSPTTDAMRAPKTSKLDALIHNAQESIQLYLHGRRLRRGPSFRRQTSDYVDLSPTTRKPVVTAIAVGRTINSLSLSESGCLVAAGSSNKQTVVADTRNCIVLRRFSSLDAVLGVSLSGDGTKLAIGGADKVVQIVDVATSSVLFHSTALDRIACVKLSIDGQKVAFGGFDKQVCVCDSVAGVKIRAFMSEEPVRGVASDRLGRRVALAGEDRQCIVYDTTTRERLTSWEHDNVISAVAMSNDGALVAAGDHDGSLRVYLVDTRKLVCGHVFRASKSIWGPPFVSSVCFAGDSMHMAATSWNGEVRVWSVLDWAEPFSVITRTDRVFSVAMSFDGSVLAVGDRSGAAACYQMSCRGDPKSVLLYEIQFLNRVLAVDVSPDGSNVAIAGQCKEIWLCNPKKKERLHVFGCQGTIHSINFSAGGDMLVSGGDDECISVWDCQGYTCHFLLPQERSISKVVFAGKSLLFAVGNMAVLYGGGSKAYSWDDRPDFDILTYLMQYPEALHLQLRKDASVATMRNAATGESIAQHALRLHSESVLESILATDAQSGFIRDHNNVTALKLALMLRKRQATKLILGAVVHTKCSTDLPALSECFALLGEVYPDLLLRLIQDIPLEEDSEILDVIQTSTFTALPPCGYLVRGSSDAKAVGLWEDVLFGKRNATDPRLLTEVKASLIPLRNFVGFCGNPTGSPFHLVTRSAFKLQRYDVFSTSIMKAAVDFKWHRIARPYHRAWNLFTLATVMLQIASYFCFFLETGHRVSQHIFLILSFIWSVASLSMNFSHACTRQKLFGLRTGWTRMLAQLNFQAALIWYLVRGSPTCLMKFLFSFSVFLSVVDSLQLTRVSAYWGVVARMSDHLFVDLAPVLLIYMTVIFAFTIPLLLMAGLYDGDHHADHDFQHSLGTLLDTISSVGLGHDLPDGEFFNATSGEFFHATSAAVWQLLMIGIVVTLPNFLIAIVLPLYRTKKENAALDVTIERAMRITELESHVYIMRGEFPFSLMSPTHIDGYPTWLHLLEATPSTPL